MAKETVDDIIAHVSAENAEQGRPPVDMTAARRSFMRSTGMAAMGAALFATAKGSTPAEAQTANLDVQILNFALNLEYLEAEFYLSAAYGTTLSSSETSGLGTLGGVTGGGMTVPFSDSGVRAYANEIAVDERAHVNFLRAVLGGNAVARPQIDLGMSFTTAARAGNLIGPSQTFSPFTDDASFLLGSYIFEDVGVTAYHGAAALITNKSILSYAAGILAVEAYHAGLVRTLCFQKGLFLQTQQISALRFYLDGTGNDDQGVAPNQSSITGGQMTSSNIVPTDTNSIVFARTPKQVLSIVYGNQAASPGLFFPNGANPGPGSSIFG